MKKLYKCDDCGAIIEEDDLAVHVEIHRELDLTSYNKEYFAMCPYCGNADVYSVRRDCSTCNFYSLDEDACSIHRTLRDDCEDWRD